MLSAEDAAIASTLSAALFQSPYGAFPSSVGGHTGIGLDANGQAISSSNDYAFLLDQQQRGHMEQITGLNYHQLSKRTREWSAEETQAQYLDEVEEYQWTQTMAVRSMLQQQQVQQQQLIQQQQEQEQLQLQFEQQLQQLGAQAHPQHEHQHQPHQPHQHSQVTFQEPYPSQHGQAHQQQAQHSPYHQQHLQQQHNSQHQQHQQQQHSYPHQDRLQQGFRHGGPMTSTQPQIVSSMSHQQHSHPQHHAAHSQQQFQSQRRVLQQQQRQQQQRHPMYTSSSTLSTQPPLLQQQQQQQQQQPEDSTLFLPREFSETAIGPTAATTGNSAGTRVATGAIESPSPSDQNPQQQQQQPNADLQPVFDASWDPEALLRMRVRGHLQQGEQGQRQQQYSFEQQLQHQQNQLQAQPAHYPFEHFRGGSSSATLSPMSSSQSDSSRSTSTGQFSNFNSGPTPFPGLGGRSGLGLGHGHEYGGLGPTPMPSIPSFPYFPPAIQKYSPEVSPAPSDEPGQAVAATGQQHSSQREHHEGAPAPAALASSPSTTATRTTKSNSTPSANFATASFSSTTTANPVAGTNATPQSSSSALSAPPPSTMKSTPSVRALSSTTSSLSAGATITGSNTNNYNLDNNNALDNTNAGAQGDPRPSESTKYRNNINNNINSNISLGSNVSSRGVSDGKVVGGKAGNATTLHPHLQPQSQEQQQPLSAQSQSHTSPHSAPSHPSSSSFQPSSSSTSSSSSSSSSSAALPLIPSYKKAEGSASIHRKSVIMRAPFPARAPPPPRSITQLEEAMMDLKVYDSCLFWGKSGAVNLKPEGNSWDDDMVIQSKDPAWVRNSVQPPIPTNQELLILPPIAKIERSIEVFFKNSHLYPPFITPLVVERAKQTRSNQISRILLNTIAGIAIRIDPDIENTNMNTTATATATTTAANGATGAVKSNKMQYMRYFNRAYGLLAHLEDIRSTYSTTYLQATLLLCYVYPKPQLRVELLKLMTEAAFLGLHVDASRWMPKPIVIQNRCWLFWACYLFDSVHHVIRGQLTQMDDHYLDAPFPQLTELDHDEGLWTRWFMVKEINLWRTGRKIHSFFQAGLKRMDRLIESEGMDNSAFAFSGGEGKNLNERMNGSIRVPGASRDATPAYFLNVMQDVLSDSEHSEAELVLALKFWVDDLPPRLQAQVDPAGLESTDPRVNGRALGLQVVYSMLKVLLSYPNMLAIGTSLLTRKQEGIFEASSCNAGQDPYEKQQQQHQSHLRQQHNLRREQFLDKIMQCIQEADRIVLLSSLVLERYPERARMSCVGVALDWCLRIYFKVVMEKPLARAGEVDGLNVSDIQAADQTQTMSSIEAKATVFSSRLKERCRVQVGKVAKLLKQFEELDHKHFFSWLTIELEALEEHKKQGQQRMIQKCLEVMTADATGSGAGVGIADFTGHQHQQQQQQSIFDGNVTPAATEFLLTTPQQPMQAQQPQRHNVSRPKSHDLQAIIRRRQQMGIYAKSGIRPNGGNYMMMSTSSSGPSISTAASTPGSVGTITSSSAAPSPSTPSSLSASPGTGTVITGVGGLAVSGVMFSDSEMKSSMAYSSAMLGGAISGAYPTMSLGSGILGNATGLDGMGASHQSAVPVQPQQQQQQQPIYHFGYHAQGPVSGHFTTQPQQAPVYSSAAEPIFSSGVASSGSGVGMSSGFYATPVVVSSSVTPGMIVTSQQHKQQQQQQHQYQQLQHLQHQQPQQQQHSVPVSLDSFFD